MIANGELAAGEPLSEMSLAGHLGVSKTPVREALLRLRQEGLVESTPRRGTYVFELDPEQLGQLSSFRLVLERAALDTLTPKALERLTVEHASLIAAMEAAIAAGDGPGYRMLDTSYHLALIRASDNAFLIEAYTAIAWRIQALLSRLLKYPALNAISLNEHRLLTREIAAGHAAEAARLLGDHIRDSEKRPLRAVAGDMEPD